MGGWRAGPEEGLGAVSMAQHMAADYLAYWPWKLVQRELSEVCILVHDNSGKLAQRQVAVGDTLWYATILPLPSGELSGELCLFGRLKVGKIWMDHAAVQHYLEQAYAIQWFVRNDTTNTYHVTVVEGTAQPYVLIDAEQLAPELRFEGERDRLTVEHRHITNVQQLQALRKLTPASAQLLADLWDQQSIEHVAPSASRQPTSSTPPELEPPNVDELGFPEGAAAERRHLVRERNRQLIRNAKRLFKAMHHGRLYCQVCGFDFSERYGELGEDYIEAHHTLPVSLMADGHVTYIDDLAMVCANCHRMLHRRRPWLGMHELMQILATDTVRTPR